VLLKPLPYPHPEQLVSLNVTPAAIDPSRRTFAPEDYFVFREQGRAFQDVGIYAQTDTDQDVNVTGSGEPERLHALQVSDSVLRMLGASPLLGRIFSASDDTPSAAPTVILAYDYWARKFGANPSAVGKTLVVDGTAREIVGVLRREFRFLDSHDLSLLLPLQLQPDAMFLGSFSYFGLARLKPGITLAQATADVERMLPLTFTRFPPRPGMRADSLQRLRIRPNLLPLKDEVIGNVGTLLWVLLAGVGLVLMIACANVANLLLVRTAAREHELALRAALGANRRRIATQLLIENVLIGLLGAICGLGLSWAALRSLVRAAPSGLPRVADIGLDLPAFLFTVATALIAILIFGLIPIFKYPGSSAEMADGRRLTASRDRQRVQTTLAAMQIAIALILLVCSGLMIRTFFELSRVNPGYAASRVQTFRLAISASGTRAPAAIPRVLQQIQDKLAAVPGVLSVAFGSSVPLDGNRSPQDNVFAADRVNEPGIVPPPRRDMFVSPGYLQTLGIPLLAGREFSWADTLNRVPVALISESFAREYWGSPAASLGRRIRPPWSDEWREVIGVVGEVRAESIDKAPRSAVYWPVIVSSRGGNIRVSQFVTFAIRHQAAGQPDLMDQVRRAVWSVDANLPLASVHTLDDFLARSMARTSFTMLTLALAGGMALVLGAIGLYGIIAYSVSLRTREIGVRVALGAQPGSILMLIGRQAMVIILAGVTLGAAAALALTRFLRSLLFGIRPADPIAYSIAVLLLSVVALAACYLPGRRALRLDPLDALRHE
jgi:predicted permease